MRRASVATGDCARLAATVSLVLAAAKVRDHAEDGDGIAGRHGLRRAASALARNWEADGARVGSQLGFDVTVLTEAVSRQEALEAQAGPGTPLLTITEPTETATGAAFGYTAILAGRPGNQAALTEAGRLFGRIAHLLDAVEDQAADAARGAWNPITATGTPVSEVKRLCEDAAGGIRIALADADLADRRLVDALLDRELRRAVAAAFRHDAAPGHRTTSGLAGLAAIAGLATVTGLCAPASPEAGPRRRRREGGCCKGCCGDCCCDCCSECACDACCEACCGAVDCCGSCSS
jgi:hypothetical protein